MNNVSGQFAEVDNCRAEVSHWRELMKLLRRKVKRERKQENEEEEEKGKGKGKEKWMKVES